MVRGVRALMNDDGSWNLDAIRATGTVLPPGEITGHDAFYCSTGGRFLGALVKYYDATKDNEALALARIIKDRVIATCFAPDGRHLEAAGWHVHSVTATINALAQLAELTGDDELMRRTESIYRAAFGHYVTTFGWSKENLSNDLDTGEVNNTGDMIQTALILARHGDARYYSDAEKMLRSHLLPSQLRDISWVKTVRDPKGDAETDVAVRTRGAFGFPAPYGHKIERVDAVNFNFDITCGTMQALCEVLGHVCTEETSSTRINLLFSFSSPGVEMVSHLPDEGKLEIQTSGTRELLVRIPAGVTTDTIRLDVDGTETAPKVDSIYLSIPKGTHTAIVRFHLPRTTTEEQLPGRKVRVHWTGETVTAIDAGPELLRFY
jgi:hypothetical protein